MTMKRTAFGLAAGALLAWSAHAADVQLTVDAGKPGPVIHRNVYGQFAEHLGTGIYEGMWVGPDSNIPNVRGWRKDVVGALKALHVPLVRWPGGCFADEYHWREGIGPRGKRPVKVNTHWGGVAENNAVGTHEFFDLVEQLGAEAYVNGNLGTGSAQEMAEWLEYMTAEGNSTLAQLRRKNGRDKPFKVSYFAVGNEAWGCGGNMTPEYYVNQYRQVATFLKTPDNNRPKFIASGGNANDTRWTEVLSTQNIKFNFDAIGHHYYVFPSGKWEGKGSAAGFKEDEWISLLSYTQDFEKTVAANIAVLDKNDPQKRIGLYLDEWGSWYDPEPGTNPGFLVQRNTLRDAVLAALHFHMFHAHADRVHMTNIAQMVNVLQAMIHTDKTRMVLTPTYHAFALYTPFQDATTLPATLSGNPEYALAGKSLPAVSASAARGKDGKLYLALINVNPREAQTVKLAVQGAAARRAVGQVLSAEAMDSENTFAKPEAVKPKAYEAQAKDGALSLPLPPKSIVVVALEG
ncbi:alpha-L-arabinofuranosidase C-terminal domain-containing protein [Mitsuaria sp. BK037]|nr:alpha-L-arabinofuranosidase C-terminal domain-containing protein [Mitsuaria sp. BK037]MBB3281404.1 alpha-N-arabinofuranosidase [Mitsuaria sp. BK037]